MICTQILFILTILQTLLNTFPKRFFLSKISQFSMNYINIKQKSYKADFLYNFYQIMSDTIYTDLKEQGLILSKEIQIGFPPIRAPKPGLIGQIVSYVVPEKNFEREAYQLIIVPILNNCFIVGRCNTLLCYKYQIDRDRQSSKPMISKPNINNLPFKIQKIHICDNKYLNDRGQIPFIIQAKNVLALYYVDLKQNKIVERNPLSFSNVLSVRFICEKEFLVMSGSGHSYFIHHIIIQSGKMREKSKIPAELEIGENQEIKQVNILGNIDQEQQSTVCLFYYLRFKDNENSQILKVKEYERDLDGKISPKNIYVILNTHNSVVLTDNYEIVGFDNYYCILIKHQILILKKKFDRYLFIDNIMEKIGGNTLKLHPKGIVTSHSGSSMEVNVILFNDPKCYSKLLDNIEVPSELSEGFLMTWPFKNEKETSLMFVFKKDKKLVFCNLRKTDPYEKMIMVVQNTPKQKISVVQQIAVNLGISKKDFYLNQWAHSKRQIPDIYQFLLPCWDIHSIKKELRMTMRRKKIEVSELLKILEKLGKIIKNELKTNLSQNLLKEYIKNDFLLRKIKLKEASKRMDHRELDKVYNSSLIDLFVEIIKNELYPEEKQLDPLHAMVQAPTKQETNLKHVFQEFRIMILQNYKRFLIKFISGFNSEQIVKVIDEYYYLLPTYQYKPNLIIHEPDYMTEVQLNQMILKAEKTQEQWFSDMTSIEFAREMSKERIQRQLHDYYPNSKIHEAINTLVVSEYGVKQKLQKHGLISCTMTEYKQKLKDIEDIKLYLKICEHVNQYNLTENTDIDLSKEIVEIFRTKNRLQGQAYYKVKLYTSMHRFMLKNNFCEKKVMTAEELIQLTPQDLVALFFLQNRQRKEFIFREFRDLFVDLYKGTAEFNQVINKFINSQNCSRIELQIFINEIKNKGEEFQIENQDLIELIIDGFCKKLEVRQDSDTERFLDIMEEIELNKKLAMKINKVNQVRGCLNIFNIFNCEKESYYNILAYQENNEIFKILLNTYFAGTMKRDVIRIETDDISLEFCRNMLTVLLYLQENVYYEVTERQLLLTYCQVLIEWKQFQVIKGIIYDEEVLEKIEIQREGFINDLIRRTLSQIYFDEDIIYDPETKQHIRSILDIYEGEHEIKTQEFAKLELVEIFESWGTIVHTHDIELVVSQWAEGNKKDFIIDLINQYISYLNFAVFEQIYRYFEMASGKLSEDVDVCNEEYVDFALAYAEKLLEEKMYEEIVKILAFVKTMPQAKKISYALLSETFLKSLTKKYAEEDSIKTARESIEYFTQNFNDDQLTQRVFETEFQSAKFEYFSVERDGSIPVKDTFCFSKKHPVSIELDLLWEIAQFIFQEKGRNIETLYYSYYFLIMIFRNPDSGFSKNHKISFNLETLTDLLFKLEVRIDENKELWGINIYTIFKRFLKGLYLEGLTRIKQISPDLFRSFHNDDAQLDAIKTRLREDKQNNSELLKCIARVQNYLSNYKAVRKTQKELRFEKLRENKQPQVVQQEIVPVQQEVENQADDGVTLNLRKFKQRKMQISRESNISGFLLSQKQILEKIYELEIDEKQRSRKTKPKGGANFFLPTFMNSTMKQTTIATIQKCISSEEWEKLRNFSQEDLIHVAETIYNSNDKDFHEAAALLRQLRIVDDKKIEVLMFCKLYLSETFHLTSNELKKLFPFTYLIEAAEQNVQEFKERMYMVMRASFESIIEGKDNDFIRHMANYVGNILSENAYVSRFYIDMIILLGKNRLEAQTIIRISIIMHILREYPQDVRVYLTNILQAFKENSQLLNIIKQELLICLQDIKEEDIEKYIKDY